jgi:PAS domain S-box-containing protein
MSPEAESGDRGKKAESAEREQLGLIQPHCAVLAGRLGDPRIRLASINIAAFIGIEAEALLGHSLHDGIGLGNVQDGPLSACCEIVQHARLPARHGRGAIDVGIQRVLGHWVAQLEWHEPWAAPAAAEELSALAELEAAPDVPAVLRVLCSQARALLGCERVIGARIHDDGHAEVLAEDRKPECNSVLGLHYPEASCPVAERLHLAHEQLRLLVDVQAKPVPVVVQDCAAESLRVVHSVPGRSVPAGHAEWLALRGIRGWLCYALTLEGRLWGMLVAHAAQPMRAGFARRQTLANRVLAAGSAITTLTRRAQIRRHTVECHLLRRLADLPPDGADAEAQLQQWCKEAGDLLGARLTWRAGREQPDDGTRTLNAGLRRVFPCSGRGVLEVLLPDPPPRRWEGAPGATAPIPGLFADGRPVGWTEPPELAPAPCLSEQDLAFLREAAALVANPSVAWSTPSRAIQLAVNSERIGALLHALPDLVLLLDDQGYYIAAHGNLSLLVLPPTDIIGQRIQDVLPPALAAAADAAIRSAQQRQGVATLEYSLPIGSEVREFEARIAACGRGEVLALIREVTQTKRLLREQALMASIIEHTDSAAVVTGADGLIRWVNPAFERLTEYAHEMVVGKHPGRLLQGPDTDPETVAYMRRCLATDGAFDCTVLNYTRSGRPFWIELRVRPVRGADGAIESFIAVQNDVTARVEAERQLKLERDVFASGPVVATVWSDQPGEAMRFVSENVQEMLGYSAAELSTPDFRMFDLMHPEDRQRVITELQEALAGDQQRIQQVYRLRHADGNFRWIEDHTVIERDARGLPRVRRGYLIDRTREQQMAEALRLSEAKLRSLFEGSAVAMVLVDLDSGLILEGNPACVALGEMDRESLCGLPLASLVEPGELDSYRERIRRLAAGERVPPCERTIIRPDGRPFRALVSGAPYLGEGRRLAWIMAQDISEQIAQRDRARQSLVELQKAYALLENAGRLARLGHFEARRSGTALILSPMARAIFRIEEHAVIDKFDDFLRLYAPEYQERLRFLSRCCFDQGEAWQMECEALTADGDRVWVQMRAEAMHDEHGAVVGMQGVVQDIDERRRIEKLLAERNRLLEETTREARALAESRSRFLANTSHEIRSPLTAILAYSERALRGKPDVAALQHAMQAVHSSARHLLAVVNDLLDSAQIEAGQITVQCGPQALFQLIEETVTLVRPAAEAKGLQLDVELDAAHADWVSVDAMRFRQVLFNLLGNGIKFTDAGRIQVRAQWNPDAARWMVDVIDQGIGIAPEQRARLFQPFSTGDASRTRRHGGTGLGLHISRELMRLMGGELECVASSSSGSTFRAWVAPWTGSIEQRETKPNEFVTGAELPRLRGRVLLAEDDPLLREILGGMLLDLGLEIDLARDGKQVIQRALADSYDLILLDMHMPGVDGVAALRRLRELGWQGTVLALTADVVPESVQRYQAEGCAQVLAKPISIEALAQALSRWLPGERAGSAAQPPSATALGTELPPRDSRSPPSDRAAAVSRVRAIFLRNLAAEIAALRREADEADLAALSARVHRLKGSSGFLGLDRLHRLLAEADATLKQLAGPDALDGAQCLELLSAVLDELQRLMDSTERESAP